MTITIEFMRPFKSIMNPENVQQANLDVSERIPDPPRIIDGCASSTPFAFLVVCCWTTTCDFAMTWVCRADKQNDPHAHWRKMQRWASLNDAWTTKINRSGGTETMRDYTSYLFLFLTKSLTCWVKGRIGLHFHERCSSRQAETEENRICPLYILCNGNYQNSHLRRAIGKKSGNLFLGRANVTLAIPISLKRKPFRAHHDGRYQRRTYVE